MENYYSELHSNIRSIKTKTNEISIQEWNENPKDKFAKKDGDVSKWKSLLKWSFFTDFCNETTIHGFNHIVAVGRHPLEKFCWAAATLLAGLGALQICMEQWQRFVANPTVVSLEKDYRNWNNTFLAITACLEVKAISSEAAKFIKNKWQVNEGDENFGYYMDFVSVVLNSTLMNLDSFEKYSNDETLNDVDLLEMSLKVAGPYNGVTAWFDREIETTFVNVMTEMGICHTINSVVSKSQAVSLVSSKNNPPSTTTVDCQYVTHPCYVRVELYKVCTRYYTHSPYEIVDMSTNMLVYICPGQDFNTDWKVVETKASDDVKALAVEQRKCRFHTEPSNQKYSVYSGGMCRQECRNRLALKLCGCRPFFYFQEDGPLCTPAGLACLGKHKDQLFRLSLEIECKCLPQCLDSTYELSSEKESRWTGPFAERSSLKIGIFPPRSRYRRQILFCFEDLVVSFGGAAGLFLGCSFLSGIEIIYFVLERIIKFLFSFKKSNQIASSKKDASQTENATILSKNIRRLELNNFINKIAEYE